MSGVGRSYTERSRTEVERTERSGGAEREEEGHSQDRGGRAQREGVGQVAGKEARG